MNSAELRSAVDDDDAVDARLLDGRRLSLAITGPTIQLLTGPDRQRPKYGRREN